MLADTQGIKGVEIDSGETRDFAVCKHLTKTVGCVEPSTLPRIPSVPSHVVFFRDLDSSLSLLERYVVQY